MGPGATALTVMSRPRSSRARISVIASTARLGGRVRRRSWAAAVRVTEVEKLMIAPPRAQPAGGELRDDEGAAHVGAVHPVEVVEIHLHDRREQHDARGVDDDVHAAVEALCLRRTGPPCRARRRRRRRSRWPAAARGDDRRDCLLRSSAIARVVDDHGHPVRGQPSAVARPIPPDAPVTMAIRGVRCAVHLHPRLVLWMFCPHSNVYLSSI